MKSVLVTGAGGGMGKATVNALSAQGWSVLAIDRNEERLAEFTNTPSITTLVLDLGDHDLCQKIEQVLSSLPTLHGLVNMAGVSVGAPITELSERAWQDAFSTNVDAPMRLTQLAAKK